jgi:hypothetical protein
MRARLLALALITILALPGVAWAQSLGNPADGSSFAISSSPQYPAPGSTATLSFLSSALELSRATISVSANGKKIYQGSVQSVPVTLGKAGSVTTITATVVSEGTNYNQTLTIQPQDVALVVEPISSAPVLYPGKPRVPLGGSARIVAMANLRSSGGKLFDPATLSYAWTIDGTQIANSSGIGKRAIMVAAPLQYRSRTVSVTVMSADGNLVGGASLSLIPFEPSVRIYENDPLLGVRFERALSGNFAITGSESALYAAPFSLPTNKGTPRIQWFLNGAAAQTGSSITLRPAGSGQGNASLSLTASVGESSMATANLSLTFGGKPSTNFFGL